MGRRAVAAMTRPAQPTHRGADAVPGRWREGHRLCLWLPYRSSMDWTSPRCACSSTSSSSAACPRRPCATASPNRRRRRKLQKLERQLGVQLLDRAPTGSVATPAGVRLAPACADVVAAAVALVDRAETVAVEQQRLVVAATRHVADHFLPGWIDARRRSTTCASISSRATPSPSPRPCVPARRTSGSPTVRRRPSGCARRSWRARRSSRSSGAVTRGSGAGGRSAAQDLVGATLALPPAGSGTLDVVDRRPRARSSSARSATASRSPARRPRAWPRSSGARGRVPARLSRRRRDRARHARCGRRARRAHRAAGARRVARDAAARRARRGGCWQRHGRAEPRRRRGWSSPTAAVSTVCSSDAARRLDVGFREQGEDNHEESTLASAGRRPGRARARRGRVWRR